ncbi:hypothetical protein TRFO_19116 [Tritrichomonas foetus]|uniref:F5/8 type C domain-containing protein n=1 Tax=Tritrichomonas foetus TaxID=1144522 RepID=A0A1J4KJG8_9EUKA|nr:hypothetical protein TRFO_19116 [Tritrichomonas foetus]|eukprot:OHT11471.1 hypothetical protein TRFO_19116 [Tritrichomonas foetus]
MSEVISISLSSHGLSNILKTCNDFHFKIGKRLYPCNQFHAQFISPKVSKQLITDASNSKFEIKANGSRYHKVFKHFIKILNGEEISVKLKYADVFIDICQQLGNVELLDTIYSLSQQEITTENAIQLLQLKNSFGGKIKQEANFIASNFDAFPEEDLMNLSTDLLFDILSNTNLTIDSEDYVFNFIKKLIDKDSKAKYLLSTVNVINLSSENLSKYFSMISFEDLTSEMWVKISKKFAPPNENSEDNNIHIDFPTNINEPFNGIIFHLNQENSGNCYKKGIVDIKASSNGFNDCSDLIDNNFRGSWCSEEHSRSWWMIDFKQNRVSLCGYTLKTQSGGVGAGHLKNWKLEGSNNEKSWTVLDSQANNFDLNGSSLTHTWNIKLSQPYRYIRIRTTGLNHRGYKSLYIAGIEFFGNIINETNKKDS